MKTKIVDLAGSGERNVLAWGALDSHGLARWKLAEVIVLTGTTCSNLNRSHK